MIGEGPAQPSEALRYFGEVARHFRIRARLTHQELGEKLHYSAGLVGHVETATRVASDEYVLRLEEALGAGGLLAAALPMLEEERHRGMPGRVQVFVVDATAEELPPPEAAKLLRRLATSATPPPGIRR
ncbi:hypothetical protein GCM10012280_16670 [Wenjunlia tyrosinilytica]|uniref:Uncharacterized protein n=1 Tax=Wenjunlia tyrosinilytica TaxID=1544741 RepID=A0A918DWC9_9ACTN|nr:hypothetical protein GCM10012280_16670 [Wenjunlia tyrosinilytica]